MQVESTIGQQMIAEAYSAEASPSRRLAVLAILGLSVVFLASFLFKPQTGEYFTICGFKNFTGLPCPGCGLTHSFCALAKGDVTSAFAYNLLGPALFLVLVLLWGRALCVLSNRITIVDRLDRLAARLKLVRAFAYAFSVYGAGRIIYLLLWKPVVLDASPLSKLLGSLFH